MTYGAIRHVGSAQSEKRGLNTRMKGGKPVRQLDVTHQIVRHPDGQPLPTKESAAVRKSYSSKYSPHVGAKQRLKLEKRAQQQSN